VLLRLFLSIEEGLQGDGRLHLHGEVAVGQQEGLHPLGDCDYVFLLLESRLAEVSNNPARLSVWK